MFQGGYTPRPCLCVGPLGCPLLVTPMPLESFRRWQSEAIKQKQTASALLLGLSGAALAFSVTQLGGASTYIGTCQSLLFHLSAAAQLISIASGIAFSLNRVRRYCQELLMAI